MLYPGRQIGTNADIVKIIEDTINNILCFKGRTFFTILNEKTGQNYQWNIAPFDVGTARNQVLWDNGLLWERATEGFFCFELNRKRIFQVRSYNGELDKLLRSSFSIYKDRAGIIWIGTNGYGLLKYNPRTEFFHNERSKSIVWMSATAQGNVLMTGSNVLHHFVKDSSGRHPVFREDTIFRNKLRRQTKEFSDMAVQDMEGTFWLSMRNLVKFNIEKKTFQVLKKNSDIMFPYFLDNRDRLWYATSDSFCVLNKITNTVTSYSFPVKGNPSSPYKFCEKIIQDVKGIFWLGTTEGLLSFNEATRRWQHYKHISDDITSISNNVVFSVCDDPERPGEYIWAGTNGGGLNRLNVSTGKFDRIGLKEGLPNMVVYGILADADMQLWMSTNNGIACLKLTYHRNAGGITASTPQRNFKYFYEENGLQSNEFNRYAYCKTRDGTLFFGGVNGFNYFNPRQVEGNDNIPNVVITDFKISNKPVSFIIEQNPQINEKQLLSKPVFLTKKIELPYSANIFSFDFASLDFTSSEKNQYQYRLQGFDKEWIQAGNTNSATYTNLDPGNYAFTVKGSNSDGVWNEKGASIRLIILSPWYMTWWFRIVLTLFTIAVIFLFFRSILQQKLKLQAIRNNIASDLHDEIGSTLSSVFIYSEVAQKNSNLNAQTNNYLRQIGMDAAKMIDALSDIVWTVNPKNDRFENVVNRMRTSAIEIFEAKGYELHLQLEEELNFINMGMEKRKDFYLTYKEAINNIAKYANGKNVWIHLSYNKPILGLMVRDDGQGFSYDSKAIGNGLGNMQKRAKNLNGEIKIIASPGSGTIIQLEFPV